MDDQDVLMDQGVDQLQEDHECDGAGGRFLAAKRSANMENDEPTPHVVAVASVGVPRLKMAPVVSRASPAKPSSSTASTTVAAAANKLRIDKIAENLKINLQQKEREAAKLKETMVNTQEAPKVTVVTQRPPQIVVKRVSPIVARPNAAAALAKSIKEEDEIERNDHDLTNLGWLNNFNLAASVGLPSNYPLSLSPPISPPTSTRVVTVQVKPQPAVQVQVRKYAPPPPASAFSLSYGGDEADGGGGRMKPAAQLKDISALLKP